MCAVSFLKKTGKNSKFLYYTKSTFRYIVPKFFFQYRLKAVLRGVERRSDYSCILERVNYYNKLNTLVKLPQEAKTAGEHSMKNMGSVYFFDSYEFVRWFPSHLRWIVTPGDTNYHVPVPSIVKARPLSGDNKNSVLLNMDKVRHFIFLKDKKVFTEKQDKVIFRGDTKNKENRQVFLEMFHDHPLFDVGDTSPDPQSNSTDKLTLYEHLDYKFIVSLEGNDVASNLKWVMSSNSIAVMPKPTCETWFMEGCLIPDYHYIEVKSDYSDFVERIQYYIEHPDEAQQIIDHAHEYIAQFQDKKRERLISLLVLKKYFDFTE
ncbi:glycosyl transferase family 90 [Porphyromonas macacae]|uniref:glycosyl transferase family 90 n=1 Tax=Porphyromonas macacae TaxID=28115 RepID=UPI0024AE6084|nr:glycosyl transferase family 90 [Porphyromonas macacae]